MKPVNVWRECSDIIDQYTQNTKKLHEGINILEKNLRKIDPSLLNEPRYNSDDWVLIQLVKRVYYAVKCYFSAVKIAEHQRLIQTFQEQITPREAIEGKITTAFKQAFNLDEGLREVGQQFEAFVRFSEKIDLAAMTNAFLSKEELNGTPLEEVTSRCYIPKQQVPDRVDDSSGEFSDDDSVEYFSCEDEGGNELALTGDGAINVAPFSLETLLTVEQYTVLAKILPFSLVKSITSLDKENTYRLTFDGPLEGRFSAVPGNGFDVSLRNFILSRLSDDPEYSNKIICNNPTISSLLSKIKVSSIEDLTKWVCWDSLLDAWKSAEGSYCHLTEVVDLRITENKVEILGESFRAGVHVTNYHLIKNNLFNKLIQGAVYSLWLSLGLITSTGYTRKPLHATLSIGSILFQEDGRILLHVSDSTSKALAFEFDDSWQTPQNFPEKVLEKLRKYPWTPINDKEVDFIGKYFVWERS